MLKMHRSQFVGALDVQIENNLSMTCSHVTIIQDTCLDEAREFQNMGLESDYVHTHIYTYIIS